MARTVLAGQRRVLSGIVVATPVPSRGSASTLRASELASRSSPSMIRPGRGPPDDVHGNAKVTASPVVRRDPADRHGPNPVRGDRGRDARRAGDPGDDG